ncbi:MAG: auxin-binding protein [Myxococcales bacterium]|nr:auxin-binding protein [Myxococcales bacterium]
MCGALLGCGDKPSAPAQPTSPTPGLEQSGESRRGLYRVRLRPAEGEIPVGRIHDWIVSLEDSEGRPVEPTALSVDGGMPQHGHGLVTAPRVTRKLSPGTFLIEGMKFHMAGTWTLNLGISAAAGRDVMSLTVEVGP